MDHKKEQESSLDMVKVVYPYHAGICLDKLCLNLTFVVARCTSTGSLSHKVTPL